MEKLLAIINLGQNIYGRWLFRRLLSGAIVVTGLTVITAMMVGGIMISSLYVAYLALLKNGINPDMAILTITAVAVLVSILLVGLLVASLSRLRSMPKSLLKEKSPAISEANDVVDAFISGFLQTPVRHTDAKNNSYSAVRANTGR